MRLPVHYSKLTPERRQAVRAEYIKRQHGLCFYCKTPLRNPAPFHIRTRLIDWSLFPENFLRYQIHLQHDHKTDLTEGVVHNYCNAVMWQYEGR